MDCISGEIKQQILNRIDVARDRIAPGRLVQQLTVGNREQPRTIRKAINELVESGVISYSYVYGQSYLERSFGRPVSVSRYITLVPPALDAPEPVGGHLVRIAPGAAFGTGSHPTTRLALKALEFVFKGGSEGAGNGSVMRALDVGTGSGVLAITAALFGVGRVLAVDVDLCAVKEARDNVSLNGLKGVVRVVAGGVEQAVGRFDLVVANLRLPTIQALYPFTTQRVGPNGLVVITGVRADEMSRVFDQYGSDYTCLWQQTEKEWGAVVFCRRTLGMEQHQQ